MDTYNYHLDHIYKTIEITFNNKNRKKMYFSLPHSYASFDILHQYIDFLYVKYKIKNQDGDDLAGDNIVIPKI